jgi:hypothetical protein
LRPGTSRPHHFGRTQAAHLSNVSDEPSRPNEY